MTEEQARNIILNQDSTPIGDDDNGKPLHIEVGELIEGDATGYSFTVYFLPEGKTLETATKEELEDSGVRWGVNEYGNGMIIDN
jgi:hypothetical protein